MGLRNFIRRFKAATGRLPHDYLQMLRVSAAKELLENGATSVQAVCSEVGYVDVAYFRSLFKRHTGLTPADYRKRFGRLNYDRGELAQRGPSRGPQTKIPAQQAAPGRILATSERRPIRRLP